MISDGSSLKSAFFSFSSKDLTNWTLTSKNCFSSPGVEILTGHLKSTNVWSLFLFRFLSIGVNDICDLSSTLLYLVSCGNYCHSNLLCRCWLLFCIRRYFWFGKRILKYFWTFWIIFQISLWSLICRMFLSKKFHYGQSFGVKIGIPQGKHTVPVFLKYTTWSTLFSTIFYSLYWLPRGRILLSWPTLQKFRQISGPLLICLSVRYRLFFVPPPCAHAKRLNPKQNFVSVGTFFCASTLKAFLNCCEISIVSSFLWQKICPNCTFFDYECFSPSH